MYFLSDLPCAFFVNGMYLGTVDGFERSAELATLDGVFCEFKAPGHLPVRFRFDEDFLFAPPEGVKLYFSGAAVAVRLEGFVRADPSLHALWQKHFSGVLLTLCLQGRVVLNFEADRHFVQIPLPFAFEHSQPHAVGNVLLLEGEGMFALLDRRGKLLVCSPGRVTERGERVTAEVPFFDALSRVARRVYENGVLRESAILSAREPDESTLALALLESVLYGLDPTPYLAPDLVEKAGLLGEFLGNFCGVVPTDETDVVRLIYERKPRVYDLRSWRITAAQNKITNLTPL